MARRNAESRETGLRDYLRAEHAVFIAVVGAHLPDGLGEPLADGTTWRLSRYELPEGHPAQARHPSELYDELELGADDVLRLVVRSD